MYRASVRLLQLASCTGILMSQIVSAAPTCTNLSGFVRLDPDLSCQISTKYPGPIYLGAPGTCFSVTIRGPIGLVVIGTGSAGLTLEGHLSPLVPSVGATPSILNEQGLPSTVNEFLVPETRRFITGRSAIDMLGGRLFTADAGVIAPVGSMEQLVVTSGTGAWAGASGVIYTRGNIIQNWAQFNGQVCRP